MVPLQHSAGFEGDPATRGVASEDQRGWIDMREFQQPSCVRYGQGDVPQNRPVAEAKEAEHVGHHDDSAVLLAEAST